MAIECVVIVIILAAIVFSFAHANRIRWIIATVPLVILPLANSLTSVIYTSICKTELVKEIAVPMILIAAMISCVWIGIASSMLHTTKMKIPYITIGILYNIVLGLILINHYMLISVIR